MAGLLDGLMMQYLQGQQQPSGGGVLGDLGASQMPDWLIQLLMQNPQIMQGMSQNQDMARSRVGPFAEDASLNTRPRVGPFPEQLFLKNSDRR